MGFAVNGKTVCYLKDACYYIKHSCVLNPKKYGINSIHGINPKITFPATGKSVDLPRFISEEMKTARKMNRTAVNQIKQPIDRSFLKATAEDFKRLTDNSYEASNLRCAFTNPESGEVFHLLSEGKTKKGLNIIRVLDKDGAYLKTIKVKPKKVVILDDYKWARVGEGPSFTSDWTRSMAHGDFVEVMARRNNPFADFEIIPIHDDAKALMSDKKIDHALKILQKRIDSGEQIDFISCSWGRELDKADLLQYAKSKNITLADLKHAPLSTDTPGLDIDKTLAQFIEKNPHIRIIQAAGNGGKDVIATQRVIGNVEGVAALDKAAHYTKYTSGRNSIYTQHMELGDYEFTATPYGYSLTGGATTEIPFSKKVPDYVLQQHGLQPNLRTKEEIEHIEFLKQQNINSAFTDCTDFTDLTKLFSSESKYKKELNAYIDDLRYKKYRLDPVPKNIKEYDYELMLEDNKFVSYIIDKNGNAMLHINGISKDNNKLCGTSFAAPIRTAKLSLWEMLKDII